MSACECEEVLTTFIDELLPEKFFTSKRIACCCTIISELVNEFIADESNGLMLERKIIEGREILSFSCKHRTEEILNSTISHLKESVTKNQVMEMKNDMTAVFEFMR